MKYEKHRMKKRRKVPKGSARLDIVGNFICIIFGLLILRLGYLTLVKGNQYEAEANSEWRSEVSVTAKRGDILDRNGATIVTSANVYRVDLDANAINNYIKENEKTIEEVGKEISKTLELSYDEVMEALNTKNEDGKPATYVPLVKGINKNYADAVKACNIYGVMVSRDTKRFYPNKNFLASSLGGINSEGNGLTGIELEYNQYLSGISGMKVGGFDSSGNKLPFVPYEYTPAIDGKDVVLTIDETIQYYAEKIAEKGLEEHKAKGVHVLVMNPNNGDILAMVNKPDYDPNNPYDGYESFEGDTENDQIQNMWRNGLISDTFEPGSTFKVMTMIAAMEENVVPTGHVFHCDGGVHYGETYVKCWNAAGHGDQSLSDILKNSCNVGFIELGNMLGKEKLNSYINKLGFGSLTGIDLPGEAEGIVKSTDTISDIDLGTIAFGQTNTVTAIQLMTAFNAIANGGDLIQPHILKEISYEDLGGTRIIEEEFTPIVKENVLSKEKTAILREYLEKTATQDGPAGSFVQGYSVGGKTGTAQKPDLVNGGYSSDKYIASMVALAPVDNPQITIFISVDEPSTGVYYGGQVATPLMKELFKNIFSYIDSTIAKERYSVARSVIIPDVRGKSVEEAKEILKNNNLCMEVKGTGNVITSMETYPGVTVKEGTKLKVYAKKSGKVEKSIIMPDLKGTTFEFAASVLDNLGLNYTSEGEGNVYHQQVPSGTLVEKGTNVKLTLKKEFQY